MFNNLSKDDLYKIVDINFKLYQERLKNNYDLSIELDDKAKQLFIDKGYDEKYGARELKRTIQRYFENSISELLLKGKFKEGSTITCSCKDDKLVYRKKTTRGKTRRS